MKISKAQTLVEYSICVTVILIVAIMMTTYMRRGLQGRYADITDFTAAQVSGSTMTQYYPYYSSEDYTVTEDRTFQINSLLGGGYRTNITSDQVGRGGENIQDINCYDN